MRKNVFASAMRTSLGAHHLIIFLCFLRKLVAGYLWGSNYEAATPKIEDQFVAFHDLLVNFQDPIANATLEELDRAIFHGSPCPIQRKVIPKLLLSSSNIEIVVIGGSVTMGAMVGLSTRWSSQLDHLLAQIWGEGKFLVKNIAIGGVTVHYWDHHLHLLAGADIILIDTSINDRGLVDRLLYNAHLMLIAMTNYMNDEDPPAIYEITTSLLITHPTLQEVANYEGEGEAGAATEKIEDCGNERADDPSFEEHDDTSAGTSPTKKRDALKRWVEIGNDTEDAILPLMRRMNMAMLSYSRLERASVESLPWPLKISLWNATADPLRVHPAGSTHRLLGKLVAYALYQDLSWSPGTCSAENPHSPPMRYIPAEESKAIAAPFMSVHCGGVNGAPLMDFNGRGHPFPLSAQTGLFLLSLAEQSGAKSLFSYQVLNERRVVYDSPLDPAMYAAHGQNRRLSKRKGPFLRSRQRALLEGADPVLVESGGEGEQSMDSSWGHRDHSSSSSSGGGGYMKKEDRQRFLETLLRNRSPLLGYAQVGSPHAAWQYRADVENKFGWILEVTDTMLMHVCGWGKWWCPLAQDLFTLSFTVYFSDQPLLKLFRVRSYTPMFNVLAKVWLGEDQSTAKMVSGFHTNMNSQSFPAIFTSSSSSSSSASFAQPSIGGVGEGWTTTATEKAGDTNIETGDANSSADALQYFEVYEWPGMQPGYATVQISIDGSSLSHAPPYKWKLDAVISC